MAAANSSVHPADRKQPWGTIIKPDFGLGYQKMTEDEISQSVNRLYFIPKTKSRTYARTGKKLSPEEIDEMVYISSFVCVSKFLKIMLVVLKPSSEC